VSDFHKVCFVPSRRYTMTPYTTPGIACQKGGTGGQR